MPRIYTRAEQGITIENSFGPIGTVQRVTLHHTAGPRATSKARAIELNQTYNRQHRDQGWGGLGYHLLMDDHGRLYEGRMRSWKGAHTGGYNTGNIGVAIHGNFEIGKLTWRQRRTLKALYRGNVKGWEFLGSLPWRGHCEQPDQKTACPGAYALRYLRWLRGRG